MKQHISKDGHDEDSKREYGPLLASKGLSLYCSQLCFVSIIVFLSSVVPIQALQSGPVLPWLSQVASSGSAPKLTTAPMVQLDVGNKYYKTMIDHMVTNFKKAVNRASESELTNQQVVSIKPITVGSKDQRVSLQDLKLEGLNNAKVGNVFVNKKTMKLNVVFSFKTLKLSGTCSSSPNQRASIKLIESANWNTTWSANVMSMVGREHFDMKRVYTSHSYHRMNTNFKDCASPAIHENIKAALLDRIKATIDSSLVEIMESIMMKGDPVDDPVQPGDTGASSPSQDLSSIIAKEASTWKSRQSRAKDKNKLRNSRESPALKRSKRQTPCQEGEELDDYVDQLFRFGTRLIRAMEPVTLPNATIELPDYNLKIFLYEGKGTRAYKFRRTKGAWVFCSNETVSLGLTIELQELRVAYKYRVISGSRLLFDGDLEARLSPKVQVQFSQAVQAEDSEEPVMQRVDRLRVFRLGRVHVVIRGLGNLTQSLSLIINSYLNDNQEELQPTFRMVEGDAVKMINRMLANVNVPLLSVV
ncbi:hypothetical protein GZH46_02831 [Fragariocoptes setiger]|uniref:Uncharacterized protein n=1 Tax=Fragariocoptes setiger TaxID=1670756 RepID=A0ABQ7S5G6_9ACAR|nr:hypothetical protein GZH46_02831 [Fragariocoptes setiger]